MNMSITIPQIFYDLIARVLPGFFFLFGLKLAVFGIEFKTNIFTLVPDSNFITSLGNGLGYFFLFYLFGWVLHSFTFLSFKDITKTKHAENLKQESDELNKEKLSSLFQQLRIKNPEVGFRIVKLRAEAKMLESTRTGMIIISLTLLSLLIFDKAQFFSVLNIQWYDWASRIILPAIIAFALYKQEKDAWNRCFGNINTLHEIVFRNKSDNITNLSDRRQGERRAQTL